MNLDNLFQNDRRTKALLGLSKQEFDDLLPLFEQALISLRYEWKPGRERKLGGGRKGILKTSAHKLACILIYVRIYPTFDVLGFLTDRDRTRAFRSVQTFLPALERTLKRRLIFPERKITSVEEFFEKFPEAKDVFLDGTERRKERPKNQKQQRKLYSGKKKGTMKKTLVLSDEKRRILLMTPSKSGRRHDKRLADKEDIARAIPPDVTLWTDTGFQGLQHPNVIMPKKATKHHPLTDEERAENRVISGIRVLSEHAISGFKRFRAAADTLRNHLPNFDDRLNRVAAGLWNLHLEYTS